MLSYLLIGMILFSLVWGGLNGVLPQLAEAAIQGADSAAELLLALCGAVCLWAGILRLLETVGATSVLGRLLTPLLRLLYPKGSSDAETRSALTENLAANLLGLGNAATPSGLRAAERMAGQGKAAERELRRFLLLNSVSVQLLPTTVCALRAAAGSAAPYSILPAVWLSSASALLIGFAALRLLELLF